MVTALADFETETLLTQTLPGKPSSFGLWLWIHESDLPNLNSIDFDAKFSTAQDVQFNIHLNIPVFDPNPQGNWHYLVGTIPPLAENDFPIALHSLWTRSRAPFFSPEEPLGVDDLTIVDADSGAATIINSFEENGDQLFSSVAAMESEITGSKEVQSGNARLDLVFPNGAMRSGRWHGLNYEGSIPTTPIPALVSREFQTLTDVAAGDQIGTRVDAVLVTLEIVGVVDFFPTLYHEQDAGFIITLAEPILARINLTSPESTLLNELFIDTNGPELTAAYLNEQAPGLLGGRSEVLEAEAIRKNIKADPLALGLRSVTPVWLHLDVCIEPGWIWFSFLHERPTARQCVWRPKSNRAFAQSTIRLTHFGAKLSYLCRTCPGNRAGFAAQLANPDPAAHITRRSTTCPPIPGRNKLGCSCPNLPYFNCSLFDLTGNGGLLAVAHANPSGFAGR